MAVDQKRFRFWCVRVWQGLARTADEEEDHGNGGGLETRKDIPWAAQKSMPTLVALFP